MAWKSALERREEIAGRLQRDGRISSQDEVARYGVSAETIRQDLRWLEARGLIRRSYGGALPVSPEQTYLEKASKNPEAKRAVARAAAGLIPDGSRVLLDSGSTALEVARALASRAGLIFYTNSLRAAELLAGKGREVCMLGGAIRLSSQAATGLWTCEQLRGLHVDWAVLGASGFSPEDGVWVESMEEAQVKAAMLRAAAHTIVAADASKLRARSAVSFAGWAQIERLVTDGALSADDRNALSAAVELLVAPFGGDEP